MNTIIYNAVLLPLAALVAILISAVAIPFIALWAVCISVVMIFVVCYQVFTGIREEFEDRFLDV